MPACRVGPWYFPLFPSLRAWQAFEIEGKGRFRCERNARGAPRVSLAPKAPLPFPFKRLPRRLTVSSHFFFHFLKD